MTDSKDWTERYKSNMKTLKDTLDYRMSWLEKWNAKLDAQNQEGDPSATGSSDSSGTASYSASGMDPEKLRDMPIKGSSGLTAEQLDAWIQSKAPSGSPFIGKGKVFLEAEKQSGNRADAILSHAAHEVGWRGSGINNDKHNWYGIGAFDATPYASAYSWSGADEGIIAGACWIADHYTKKGQDTYRKMRWNNGTHQYATDADWDKKICTIWSGAPASNISSGAGSVGDMNVSGYFTIKGGTVIPPGGNRRDYNTSLAKQTQANNGADLVALPSDKYVWYGSSSDGAAKVNKYFINALLLIYTQMEKAGMLTGNKMKVNSAYRFKSPETGAVPDPGAHGWGGAVDIGTSGLKQSVQLADLCWGIGFRAIGVGKTFIHVDAAPAGKWSYGYGNYTGPGSIKA